MTDLPHFSLPFRFAPSQAAVNEQDSIDEIADCVLAILMCPLGFRVELPTFGLADPTFTGPVDTTAIQRTIDQWEPRAHFALSARPDRLDELITRAQVTVQVRTES
jgi:phage baseplate assembly protein W